VKVQSRPSSRLDPVDAQAPSNLVLAEDEPMIGRILEFKLKMEGHNLLWVRSAREAEALVRKGGVDLLLCDVTLEEDGRELCRRLIKEGLEPPSGIVLMPEQRNPEGREQALAAGAREVILKPFKPTVVAATIRRLLDQPV
jgi:two-component system cell cycle response regulator